MAERRPTKLTSALLAQICDDLRQGHTKTQAAAHVGVHRATLHGWEQRGRDARARIQEGGSTATVLDRMYARFVDEVELAWDYGEWFLMQLALDIATGKIKGRATEPVMLLERTRPDQWRRRAASEFVKPDVPKNRIDVSKLDRDERARLRELLQKARDDEQ